MFYHDSDKGCVFPVVSIEIRCGMSLNPKGIVIAGVGKISKISPMNQKTVKIVCSNCNKEVHPNNIIAACMQCGEVLPTNHLFGTKECGGVYCASCINIYFPGKETFSIAESLTKLA